MISDMMKINIEIDTEKDKGFLEKIYDVLYSYEKKPEDSVQEIRKERYIPEERFKDRIIDLKNDMVKLGKSKGGKIKFNYEFRK